MIASESFILTPFERLRFLIVDDDRAILELVDALLRASGAAGVTRSTSCLGALNILADKTKRADCIVCDNSMPNMTGLELLRDIRSAKYEHVPPDMRFVMITAHGQEEVVRAAIGLDVSGYLVKPVSKDALTKAVQRAFGRRPLELKSPADYAAIPLPPDI